MIKSLIKGLLFAAGFVLGIYLLSHFGLFGFGEGIKEWITNMGELIIKVGEFFVKIGN